MAEMPVPRLQIMPATGGADPVFTKCDTAAYAEEQRSIKEQLKKSQETLNQMEPVAHIQAINIKNMNTGDLRKWIIEKLRPTSFKVDRREFGEIIFDEKRINTGLNYLDTKAEAAAYQAIPQVLKRGIEIAGHDNHKNRDYKTVTFAAPITINGKRGNMAVVVKKTNRNYYKMHRVLTPDGKMFVFSENEDAELTTGGGLTQTSTHATPISSASNLSIAGKAENVKMNETSSAFPAILFVERDTVLLSPPGDGYVGIAVSVSYFLSLKVGG